MRQFWSQAQGWFIGLRSLVRMVMAESSGVTDQRTAAALC